MGDSCEVVQNLLNIEAISPEKSLKTKSFVGTFFTVHLYIIVSTDIVMFKSF